MLPRDARAVVRLAAGALAFAVIAWMIAFVTRPFFATLTTFGYHDWDSQTAHRFLVVRSLLEHRELPFWNPYACGGFPAWGYVEADTILVSPWLPLYLTLPLPVALRLEVLGMAALGALGAYFLGAQHTKSHAARALVAVLWAVNGRWALQASTGHTWHLAYAYTPFCLAFFEAARRRPAPTYLGRLRVPAVLLGGASFAMLVYAGGIYPLPHTVLAVGLYALVLALAERSLRPLVVLATMGALAVGLAAPKLLPLLDGFGKVPRLIESREATDLGAVLTALTAPDQVFGARPARVPAYGWHEWGQYVGVAGVALLALGFVAVEREPRSRDRAELGLRIVAFAFVMLGFGAFHKWAPWTLLHEHVPVFKSQHVPSRFHYPAVLVLAVLAARGLGRIMVDRRRDLGAVIDVALVLPLALLAYDIATEAQKPMKQSMWMVPPAIPRGTFHFREHAPYHYKKRDWAGPIFLAMLGDTGVIRCYGTPDFEPRGARSIDDERYQGEAFVVVPERGPKRYPGTFARVERWSPNTAELVVENAPEGALVVYNMNYDSGWRADVATPEAFEAAVAVRVPPGTSRVRLWYRPPGLGLGLALFAITLGVSGLVLARSRREEERGS